MERKILRSVSMMRLPGSWRQHSRKDSRYLLVIPLPELIESRGLR
jgi:hypothetical protein